MRRTLLCSPPSLEGHDAVMEDMEEGEVGELLLQDKKDRVEHVEELRDIKDPAHHESSLGLRVV